MSDFASTMSMLERSVVKNGHRSAIAFRVSIASGRSASTLDTAAPKPYQPGSISRHCDQENTHGIARRSSMAEDVFRDAGRLPMLRLAISPITVASRK